MKKKFKTNIKCSACVEKVTPFLNEAVGENRWSVDLTSPQRTLTIDSDTDDGRVKESLKQAGYVADAI